MPAISVIIPAYNAKKTIRRCLDSFKIQTFKDFEVIVVDNASRDNTLQIIREFDVKWLVETIRSSYAARNLGASHATGPILVFTDSDCVATPDWLQNIHTAFQNPKIKLLGGNIKAYRPKTRLLRYLNVFGHPQHWFFRSGFFATSNMAVRKKSFIGFDANVKSGGDFNFCDKFDKVYFEPKAVVRHIYENSLSEFVRKNHFYGKYQGMRHYVKMPNYIQILEKWGVWFVMFKALQDISFKSGQLRSLSQSIRNL